MKANLILSFIMRPFWGGNNATASIDSKTGDAYCRLNNGGCASTYSSHQKFQLVHVRGIITFIFFFQSCEALMCSNIYDGVRYWNFDDLRDTSSVQPYSWTGTDFIYTLVFCGSKPCTNISSSICQITIAYPPRSILGNWTDDIVWSNVKNGVIAEFQPISTGGGDCTTQTQKAQLNTLRCSQ